MPAVRPGPDPPVGCQPNPPQPDPGRDPLTQHRPLPPPSKTRRASPSSPGTSTSGPPTPPPLEYIPPIPGLLHYRQMGGLGTGAFGRVILARDTRDNALVAIKLLPRGDFIATFKTYVMREIMHQGSLWHPHVVALREVFTTPQYLAIAMEYAAGGDLFRHLRHERPAQRLPEAEARRVFQQLVIGLDYCHTRVGARGGGRGGLNLSGQPRNRGRQDEGRIDGAGRAQVLHYSPCPADSPTKLLPHPVPGCRKQGPEIGEPAPVHALWEWGGTQPEDL